jgi:hypothetical protein
MTTNTNVSSTIAAMIASSGPVQMGSSLLVEGDRTTHDITSVTQRDTGIHSERATAGSTEEPTTVPAMTAAQATEEHLSLVGKIADLDSLLAAQTFDPNTGKVIGFKTPEGTRQRELLQIQRQSFDNALQYLGQRSLEQLPKRAASQGAADGSMQAAVQREQNITTLADTTGSNGRPIGRVAATRLIDEAAHRALADKLVRRS